MAEHAPVSSLESLREDRDFVAAHTEMEIAKLLDGAKEVVVRFRGKETAVYFDGEEHRKCKVSCMDVQNGYYVEVDDPDAPLNFHDRTIFLEKPVVNRPRRTESLETKTGYDHVSLTTDELTALSDYLLTLEGSVKEVVQPHGR